MLKKILGSVALLALMAGCASNGKNRPSCPVPDGTQCMSTLDVYEKTNSSDHVVGSNDQGKPVPTTGNAPAAVGQTWSTHVAGDTLALQTRPTTSALSSRHTTSSITSTSTTEPFREPAKVMRIYVQAWEDEQGDLHTPAYIFTEIEPRRWSVGRPALDANDSFRLLEGLGSEAAQDARAGAVATAPAGRPVRNGATTSNQNLKD